MKEAGIIADQLAVAKENASVVTDSNVDINNTTVPPASGGSRGTGSSAGKGGSGTVTEPDFIVTSNGTVMDTSKDYNLVSTTTPTNQGREFFQIHNSKPHGNSGVPHTHKPEVHGNPETGAVNVNRVCRPTSAADIDYADTALRNGILRERINRKDKGGPR